MLFTAETNTTLQSNYTPIKTKEQYKDQHRSRCLRFGKKETKSEVGGKRKERDMAISCLLANKIEGSKPWLPKLLKKSLANCPVDS